MAQDSTGSARFGVEGGDRPGCSFPAGVPADPKERIPEPMSTAFSASMSARSTTAVREAMLSRDRLTRNRKRPPEAPTMADEPAAIPGDKRPRVWVFLAGVLVFRLLNSLHWALAGGLGWGFGVAAASLVPLPGSATLGGAVGLALVMLGVLTVGWGERSEQTPITLAAFGGAAVGSASLALLSPLGLELN